MARLDVNLRHRLIVDSHLQALVFGQLLIVALADTVEAASLIPGSVVECAVVALMLPACDLEAREEIVQFLDVPFKLISLRRALVFDDASALFVLATTTRIVPEHQRVRR